MNLRYLLRFLSGPVAALLIILFIDLDPQNPMLSRMLAVTVWMALWWLTEVVHLAVTSLLPFLLIPMLGIVNTTTIANEYMDPIMFLFIGGFIIAIAIERWDLHKRVALRILMAVGSSPSRILAGVMLTTYLISLWISNTATAMMMIAAVTALIQNIEHDGKLHSDKMATGLLIGMAYSATIGGMGTLVGTPPNMVFYRFYEKSFPQNQDMDFTTWFTIGFPASFAFLALTFLVLRWMFVPSSIASQETNTPESTEEAFETKEDSYFKREYKKLGKMDYEEKVIAGIFLCTTLLWFTRADIDFGSFTMRGWKNIFPKPENIQDGTVAIAMALLLFFIPSRSEKGRMLLTWDEAKKLPFHIVLLFGSGFALAKGFEQSGLSNWLAGQLHFMKDANPFVLVLSVCVLVTVISEFASNVASIQLMLPILLPLVTILHVHPLLLMLPATLAASLGFMLPVATGPNTIVFGSGRIHIKDMMRAGLAINIIGILLITAAVMLWK